MGNVQILAVLTMDGCLSSELYDKAHQDLCIDRCGLDEIRKKAFDRVTPVSYTHLDVYKRQELLSGLLRHLLSGME